MLAKYLTLMFNSQSNIIEFSRDVRLLAALQDDQSDGDKLLDAARKLASAFSDLLNAAQPGSQEVWENNHFNKFSIYYIFLIIVYSIFYEQVKK